MKELTVKYNPYTVKTEITIDGNPPKRDSRLFVQDKVLQSWIENLPQIVYDEFNSKKFEITYEGLVTDFEDVKEIVDLANGKGFDIKLSFAESKSDVVSTYDKVLSVFEEIKKGEIEDLKTDSFNEAFSDIINSEFPVAVFATMSAGKSTLINAMLSHDIMPSQNEACTAVITKVRDTDGIGCSAVAYDKDDNVFCKIDSLTLEKMEELNNNPDISVIEVNCDIPFVKANNMSLVIIDTPGPNNARDENHRIITTKMLNKSEKNIILFILNATNTFSNDEDYLIREVVAAMETADKQVKDRFIFIVNKLDEYKKDKDDVAKTLNGIRESLIKKGIENPKVFPISALAGLYIRTVSDDEEDEDKLDDKDKFVRKLNRREDLHFEQYAPLTEREKRAINNNLAEAEDDDDDEKTALIHSGVVSVESAICTYLTKYAKTEKIRRAVKYLLSCVNDATVFEETKIALAKEKDKRDMLKNQLDELILKIQNAEGLDRVRLAIDAISVDKEIKKIAVDHYLSVQKEIEKHYPEKGQRVDYEQYNEIVKPIINLAKQLESRMIVDLQKIIEEKTSELKDDLFSVYKKELQSLIDEEMKGNAEIKITIPNLELKKYDFSRIKSKVVKEKEKTETHTNYNKKWYKPWTWFESSTYETTETVKYVDLDKVRVELAEYQKSIARNADAAVRFGETVVDETKESFMQFINESNSEVLEKLYEYKDEVNADISNSEERIAVYSTRMDWLNGIKSSVDKAVEL